MLIPWNTDAPIYHAPWATGGFILVNVAVFGAMLTSGDADQTFGPWILSYGDGLHPLQWITSNFLHAGVLHLLGNMIFLWAFGLVVEGKLGWWRFIAVYLGLGVAQCAFEQCCMLGAEEGGSLGASAIIYGLLAMAMVWAPKNEINCVFIGGFLAAGSQKAGRRGPKAATANAHGTGRRRLVNHRQRRIDCLITSGRKTRPLPPARTRRRGRGPLSSTNTPRRCHVAESKASSRVSHSPK